MPIEKKPGVSPAFIAGLTLCCWLYLLGGSGTGMSAWSMSTMHFPPHETFPQMSVQWGPGYVMLMLAMWFTMMLGMMLPALMLQAYSEQEKWSPPTRFLWEYALVWLCASLAAVALQLSLEKFGMLDGMRMWSVNSVLSYSLLGLAGLSQLWWLLVPKRLLEKTAPEIGSSGYRYGLSCLKATAPIMLLLFVGGVMNIYWISALTVWVIVLKMWPLSRLRPSVTIMICFFLALLV